MLVRHVGARTAVAALTAAILTVSHDYIGNYSLSFGLGFAVLPIGVYVIVALSNHPKFWRYLAIYLVSVAAADPMKVGPALAPALLAATLLCPHVRLTRVVLGFMAVLAVWLANWHEVLFALIQAGSITARGYGTDLDQNSTLSEAVAHTLHVWISFWPPVMLLVLGGLALAWRRDQFISRAIAAVLMVLGLIVFADAFPWHKVGLEPINRLSHQQYMILAMLAVAPLVVGRAFADGIPMAERLPAFLRRPAPMLGAMAFGMMTLAKAQMAVAFLLVGGQSIYAGIPALAQKDWSPQPGYRTVSLYEHPTANIVAGLYDLDTFDGQLNLNNRYWSAYWGALQNGAPSTLVTRPGWNWDYWQGTSYDVEKHLNLDLLAIANVRYLLSPLPLNSSRLHLLHSPPTGAPLSRARPEMVGGLTAFLKLRVRQIFSPGDIYVYELPEALPRAFAVKTVIVDNHEEHSLEYHARIAQTAMVGDLVVVPTIEDATRLGAAGPINIDAAKAVVDGYDITLSAPKGGIVAVNSLYWPWWDARADGHPVPVVAANGVQIAVAVPPQTKSLTLRYQRPLLRELLLERFRK